MSNFLCTRVPVQLGVAACVMLVIIFSMPTKLRLRNTARPEAVRTRVFVSPPKPLHVSSLDPPPPRAPPPPPMTLGLPRAPPPMTPPPPPMTPPPPPKLAQPEFRMPPVLETGNRITYYESTGGFGFGNQVRGMVYMVLHALLSNRRPVLPPNFPMYTQYFTYPGAGATPANLHGRKKKLVQSFCEKDVANSNQCLSYTEDIIATCEGVTMDVPIFQDPKHAATLKKMFGSDKRWIVTPIIIKWLFSKPKEQFVTESESYRIQNGLTSPYLVFQLRAWSDVASKHKPELIDLDCIELAKKFNDWNDALPASNPLKNKHVVYLTSDSKLGMQRLLNAVNPIGVNNTRIARAYMASDFHHTSSNRGPKISSAMIDWYLMGTPLVEELFCSGTTFCISAAARERYPPVPLISMDSRISKKEFVHYVNLENRLHW